MIRIRVILLLQSFDIKKSSELLAVIDMRRGLSIVAAQVLSLAGDTMQSVVDQTVEPGLVT